MHKNIFFFILLIISQQVHAMGELRDFDMEHQLVDFSHKDRIDPKNRLADHAHNQNLMRDLSNAVLTSSSTAFYKLMNNLRDLRMIQEKANNGLLDQWLPKLKSTNDVVISNLQLEQQTHSNRSWMLGSGSMQSLISGAALVAPYVSFERLYRVFKYGHTVEIDERFSHLVLLAPLIPSLYGLYTGGKKAYNGVRYSSFIQSMLLENLKIQALLAAISTDKNAPEQPAELPQEGLNLQAHLAKPDDFN